MIRTTAWWGGYCSAVALWCLVDYVSADRAFDVVAGLANGAVALIAATVVITSWLRDDR